MNEERKNRLIKILDKLKEAEEYNIKQFSDYLKVSVSTVEKDISLLRKYLPILYTDFYPKCYYIDKLLYENKDLNNSEILVDWIANENDPYFKWKLTYLRKQLYGINILPNKETPKYTQIKNFKDYELTYCIANEMAIRNKNVHRMLEFFHNSLKLRDKLYQKPMFRKMYDKNYQIPSIFTNNMLYDYISGILKKEYLISPLEIMTYDMSYYPKTKYSTYFIPDETKIDIKDILEKKVKINTNKSNTKSFNGIDNIFSNKYEATFDGFILEQASEINSSTFKYSTIKQDFSRKICDNNLTEVLLNFSLPKNELLAYITHIKDNLYPDKIKAKRIMTPEELKRDQIYEKDFVKLKKETIIDHFFIYDFVNACRVYLKEHNKDSIENAKEDEIKRTRADVKEFLIDDIFNHKILKSKIHFDRETVKNYYYKMYDFIEKVKYKELISSAFVKPKLKKDGRYLTKDKQQKKRDDVFTIFNSIESFDLFNKDKINIKKIANEVGVSQSIVYDWRKTYIKLKRSSENPEYKIEVRGRPKTKNLDKTNFFTLLQSKEQIWDKYKIQSLLESKNIYMSISSINNYLEEFGLVFKDNIYVDGIKVKSIKQFIDGYFPKMNEEAKKNNALIFWTDANSNKSISLSKDKNIYIKNLISYSHNKYMFALYSNNTINELLDFLNRLIITTDKKIYLIIDNFNKNDYPEVLNFEEINSHQIQII